MSKAKQLEEDWGMPLIDILKTVIETTDNQAEAAARLGVSQPTISLWIRLLGGKIIRRIEYTYYPTNKDLEMEV